MDRFSAMFYKGDNFCDFLFAFLHINSFLQRNEKKFWQLMLHPSIPLIPPVNQSESKWAQQSQGLEKYNLH